MNTREINTELSNYDCFYGTFPIDRLPILTKRPASVIINTDPAHKPGEHWVAIYLTNDNDAIYFDSFGLKPLQIEIYEFLEKHNVTSLLYNVVTIQSVLTSTCGLYAILFVKYMCNGFSYCKFLQLFGKNKLLNDMIALLKNL